MKGAVCQCHWSVSFLKDVDHIALRPQKRGGLLGTGTGGGGGGGGTKE